MYDWDSRSEMPEVIRDRTGREEPRLQEYDWVHERSHDRVPIAIIDSILADLGEEDDSE